MCGIVGCFGDAIDENWVIDSLSKLKHRGPDNQNYNKINAFFICGAARLSMTDPHPRSNQPFYDLETGSALVFNGEIYNYKELKNELQFKGITFKTESDTEVLFRVLLYFGAEGINKLNGMFSIAFYSGKLSKLILSRDSLGKKPLYYKVSDKTISFASSIKLLSKDSGINDLPLNLVDYFTLGYFIDPNTPFENIFAIAPGEILIADQNLKISKQKILKNNVFSSKHNLRTVIKQALSIRIEGHERFGISLSGGVDSHILAKLSSEITLNFTAYSVSWREADKERYNLDADQAKQISKFLGIKFVDVGIFPVNQLKNYIDKYLNFTEEPNANPTGLSMLFLYEQMKLNGERLVITGDGADEILGGYPRYERQNLVQKLPRGMFSVLKEFKQSLHSRNINHLISVLNDNRHAAYWLHWHQIFNENDLKKYMPEIFKERESLINKLQTLIEINPKQLDKYPRHYILMLFDNKFWLPNESNRRLDRVSMANSIEARSPFQDDNVITFANSISSDYKKINKKNYLKKQFPDINFTSLNDSKRGFISPIGFWLRSNSDLIIESMEYLSRKNLLDNKNSLEILISPQNKDFAGMQKLWSLIIYSRWLQINEK